MSVVTPPFPFSISAATNVAAVSSSSLSPAAGQAFDGADFIRSQNFVQEVRGLPLEVIVPSIQQHPENRDNANALRIFPVIHGAVDPAAIVRTWNDILNAFGEQYTSIEFLPPGIQFFAESGVSEPSVTITWQEMPFAEFHKLLMQVWDAKSNRFQYNARFVLPDEAAGMLVRWGYAQYNQYMSDPRILSLLSPGGGAGSDVEAVKYVTTALKDFSAHVSRWQALAYAALSGDRLQRIWMEEAVRSLRVRGRSLEWARLYASETHEYLPSDAVAILRQSVRSDGGASVADIVDDAIVLAEIELEARRKEAGEKQPRRAIDRDVIMFSDVRHILESLALVQPNSADMLLQTLGVLVANAAWHGDSGQIQRVVNIEAGTAPNGDLILMVANNGGNNAAKQHEDRSLEGVKSSIERLGWGYDPFTLPGRGSSTYVTIPAQYVVEHASQRETSFLNMDTLPPVRPVHFGKKLEELQGVGDAPIGLQVRYPRLHALHTGLVGSLAGAQAPTIVYDPSSSYAAQYVAEVLGSPTNWRGYSRDRGHWMDQLRSMRSTEGAAAHVIESAQVVYWSGLGVTPVIPDQSDPRDILGERVRPRGYLVLQHDPDSTYSQNGIQMHYAHLPIQSGWECLARVVLDGFALPTFNAKGKPHMVQVFRRGSR